MQQPQTSEAEVSRAVHFRICPTKISGKTENKYREKMMKEIINAVCALMNSDGGNVVLRYEKSPPDRHVADCVRMIEQRVREFATCAMVTDLQVKFRRQELAITVKGSVHLVTMSYNLYLPSESQVMSLPSYEPVENIKEIILKETPPQGRVLKGTHCKDFVRNTRAIHGVNLRESKVVQVKILKDASSKRVTIADRMVGKSNKFVCYISGFANHLGGHIYYGICDDGNVLGEEITAAGQDQMVTKVTNAINKMKWPEKPQRGTHWEIYFEPVNDGQGHKIPSRFVIVVFVGQCPGGVFAEEPESYHLVDGEVKKMSWPVWSSRFLPTTESVPSGEPGKEARYLHDLATSLIKFRNDQDMKKFSDLSKKVKEECPEGYTHLLIKCEEITDAYKKHNFRKAEDLLDELELHCREEWAQGLDQLIVRVMYLRSCLQSLNGNYQTSYITAQQGLKKMKSIQKDVIKVWLYMHVAMLNIILSSTSKSDFGLLTCDSLRKDAVEYLKLAQKEAKALEHSEEDSSDLQRKLHIYKAFAYLGCSPAGEAIDAELVTRENISKADEELAAVRNSEEHPLSHYREIQFLLAYCDLLYRRKCNCRKDRVENLSNAFKSASKARTVARKYHFFQMVPYSDKRLATIAEELVCKTVRLSLKKRVSS